MDGCLLDTIWLWHEAEQRVLDTVGITLTKEQRDELNALTLDEAATWFHERFGIMGSGEEVARAIVDYMLSPSTFEHMCGLLGTEPADTWLFDDSWYALATAHECGLKTVGTFSSDGCGTHEELARYCDVVVDDFTELDPNDFLK